MKAIQIKIIQANDTCFEMEKNYAQIEERQRGCVVRAGHLNDRTFFRPGFYRASDLKSRVQVPL